MTLQIKKISSTAWAGNGFGNEAASWAIVGTDIVVWKGVSRWTATKGGKTFARADTSSDLLEVVEAKI